MLGTTYACDAAYPVEIDIEKDHRAFFELRMIIQVTLSKTFWAMGIETQPKLRILVGLGSRQTTKIIKKKKWKVLIF